MPKRLTLFAVLLTVGALVAGSFAVPSAAAETVGTVSAAETETQVTESEEVTILREDTALRGEYEKHFLLSDGSYQAAVYNEPVHKLEDGAWVEIDNTLTLQSGRYATADGLMDVSFAQSVEDQLVTMTQGEYSLSWGVQAVSDSLTATATAQAQPATQDLSGFTAEEQKTLAAKSSSAIRYSNALRQDVDLEYVVLPSRVKENIILQSKQDISGYLVTVYAENLSARLLESREIEFYDGEDVIFTMASPYMYDAAGELSEDITVEMVSKGGVYFIAMTPNADWLNDESRVYPVTIDPDVSADSARSNIIDNYALSEHSLQNANLDRLYIGAKWGGTARAYIQYATMPTIPEGSTITSATMTLTFTSGTSTAYTADAYMVTGGEWESGTLTWDNKPAADTLLQSNISHNNVTGYTFSCLAAVRAWYTGDTTGQNANYGVMVRYTDETIADYNAVYSADYSGSSKRPALAISYQLPSESLSVQIGSTYTLSVTELTDTITWTSGDTAIATVSNAGVVTGVKAGRVTITALVNGVVQKVFTVYVRLANGAYYIQSEYSGLYMSALDGKITEGTRIVQNAKASSPSEGLWQLWRIQYLSEGQYSIRPLHKVDMGLESESDPSIKYIGMTDTSSSIDASARWSIEWTTNGYAFRNCERTSYVLCSTSNFYDGAYITAGLDDVAYTFCWDLEKVTVEPKVLFYAADIEQEIDSPRRGVAPDQTSSLSTMNLMCVVSTTTSYDLTVTWSSSNPSIATVNSSTGAVTGVAVGTATINASARVNGKVYSSGYTLVVSEIPISGSELEYEPDLWNVYPTYVNTNCYAYAFDTQYLPAGDYADMQPGHLAGLIMWEAPNAENVPEYVRADAEAAGFMFEPIHFYEYCPTGAYKVAFMIDEGRDFHWYRQNPDGTWSHKRNGEYVTNLDSEGKLITNPQTAKHNYPNDLNYVFVEYYCVTPLTGRYTPSSSTAYSTVVSDTNQESEQNGTISVSNAGAIAPKMTCEEVVAQIGEPHQYRMSDQNLVEYNLEDGSILVIEFEKYEDQYVVKECWIEGSIADEESS